MERNLGIGVCAVALSLTACGGGGGSGTSQGLGPPVSTSLYQEVSALSLPQGALNGMCMDARHGDVDGDGDLDLVLAQEFSTNLLLRNDGSGNFSVTLGDVVGGDGDNEDLLLQDFDNDGDLDMFTVHEDDRIHAFLLNDGQGRFTDASNRIAVSSIANAAEAIDLNNDGRLDVILGNRGTNLVLLQDANGTFNTDLTRPVGTQPTQDLLLFDADGDTDMDLFIANEGLNRLLINNGNGFFNDETTVRLGFEARESRQADAADIDNDGDLDLVLGNVSFSLNSLPSNQLLINDGTGVFTDETDTRLPEFNNQASSFTVHFVDLDSDGDADILSPSNNLGNGGSVSAWINDGTGQFTAPTTSVFSAEPSGSLFDIEVADFNGDGNADLYFCYRTGTDQLYFRQ
ncbi:MAG: FG-GAP repeat domain-containing protein [Gammaproteobacteria bacterium]